MSSQPRALTKILVEKTKPEPDRDVFLWDTKVPGFGVRIYPSGKRKYVFQYRTKTRQQRRMVLGVHGPLTTEKARDIAADKYEAVRKERDPVQDQRLAASRGRDTVERVVDEFMTKYMEQKKRARSYIDGTRGLFDNHILPRWRGRDIRSITRRSTPALALQGGHEGEIPRVGGHGSGPGLCAGARHGHGRLSGPCLTRA